MRDEYHSNDLDPALLERFLREFSHYSKQRSKHSFTGGEPTLHRDLDGLFQAFRNTGHSLYIVSNGQNERGVESVIRNKDVIDYMSISLDAANAELNDLTRGKGSFDKVVENTRIYRQNGVAVDFRFVLHDRNAPFVEAAFELAMELGLSRIRFSTMHPIAKEKAGELTVTYDVLLNAYKKILELRKKYPEIKAGMNTRHMIPFQNPEWPRELCTPIGGPLNGITLLPDGKILFCCDFVDLSFDYSRYTGFENPDQLDPVIGDYNVDSLELIMKRKRDRIRLLRAKRQEDVANGNLIGNRQYICENCKFYHFFG
jgi:MoaA/NifB/PqqE/SkfB family radical SAM enzyme